MNFASFQDILDFAIEREEEAARAYADMGAGAKSESLKRLLAELEDEEKKHKALLLNLTGLAAETLVVKPVTDLKISDYLVAEVPHADMNFQDLLILAAQKEQKSVELYRDLGRRVAKDEHKRLFEFLMMQEESHKLKLETEYEKHVLSED